MLSVELERGRLYRRRTEIHARFGGQQQGGISTPKNYPVVFLFSGSEGRKFGYSDSWTASGTYDYYGEGPRGDMELVRGNRAILEHSKQGEAIHLFMNESGGLVRYEGEMVCGGYREVRAPDEDGDDRRAYVFVVGSLGRRSRRGGSGAGCRGDGSTGVATRQSEGGQHRRGIDW